MYVLKTEHDVSRSGRGIIDCESKSGIANRERGTAIIHAYIKHGSGNREFAGVETTAPLIREELQITGNESLVDSLDLTG